MLAWAAAWSRQDVSAYLAYYIRDFKSFKHNSHKQWAAERTGRINKATDVQVTLESIDITVDALVSAHVRFRQVYRAKHYSDVATKQVSFYKMTDGWKITREFSE